MPVVVIDVFGVRLRLEPDGDIERTARDWARCRSPQPDGDATVVGGYTPRALEMATTHEVITQSRGRLHL